MQRSCGEFVANMGMSSILSSLTGDQKLASYSFSIDERVAWIDIEGWAPDFPNSHDDSSESDDESVEGKSKDVYSEKVSEAEEILEIIFEVEEPDLNATIQSEREPKYPSGFTPRDTSDINSLGADNQDINMFHKENSTVSDYFIAIIGKWLPNDKNLLIISVYAPQELSEKRMLWQYLVYVIEGWKGDVIVMGDFNEVRTTKERFGSIFNARGAAAFNSLISTAINIQEPNAMLKLVKKLKLLKGQIRLWVKDKKDKPQLLKNSLKKKLVVIDSSLYKGDATSDALEDRLNTMNNLTNLERMESLELAQKAKIKWSIE
ncbi:RNA-directed DNA polymerase, eukaryota [Tanacetum coccineum]